MTKIHSTAIVDPNAVIGNNCVIGPFCIVHENVKLGDNNELVSSVIIDGHTTIGDGNKFFHSAVIGTDCQDLKYKGEPTKLIIGNNNTFREFCTINKSATMDEPTQIGDNCLFMAYSHVAHNCILGNNLIIANAVNFAGHIHVHDNVIIGGMVALHQFVKVGTYAFIGGKSGIKKDIPPYTRGEGSPYIVRGLNSVGLQRRGFSNESIKSIKYVYKLFYKSGFNTSQAMEKALQIPNLTKEQKVFLDFIKNSDRGITK
ncbi:MAG: acyl-ACP--UDP-N-acetylglucosamine O-acyltransferase [Candidatus Cloacimonetes bacterium]|nr:acyl-ACP--UDP-N-acetylglucosamine O-acyltransferase [Candidatus Cloacimonadota bacterium]